MRHFRHPSFLLVVIATLVFGSVSLIFPFGRDQGIHAFIADAALHGRVVYRDVFNVKPPLTTLVHALALLLFGHSMTSIRLLDLFWTLATALVLAALAARIFGNRWVGAVAGALYPLLYYPFGYWHTAQTDGWLNLPLAAALLLILQFESRGLQSATFPRARLFFWPGLFIALATLLKYTAAIALPLLAIIFVLPFVARGLRFSFRLRLILWLGLGFATGIAACGLLLLATGALPAFIQSQFGLMPAYVALGPTESLFRRFSQQLLTTPCLRNVGIVGLIGIIATFVFFLLRHRSPFSAQTTGFSFQLAIVIGWFVTALVSVFAQAKFFEYHYLPLLGVVAVLGAGVVALFLPWLRRLPVVVNLGLGLVLAAGAALATGYGPRFANLAQVAGGQVSLRQYWDSGRHDSGSDFSLREDLALADYIAANTDPTDRIFIWGYEPLVYFVARRWPVSRFIYNFPLVVSWRTADFRSELVAALAATPPRLMVVAHGDATPWVMGHDKDSYASLLEFPELLDFIRNNYFFATSVERFDILFRAGN